MAEIKSSLLLHDPRLFRLLCQLLSGPQALQHEDRTLLESADTDMALLHLARSERVLPALHLAIRDSGLALSKPVRTVLVTEYTLNQRTNTRTWELILELGRAAAAMDTAFAVLKGAAWIAENPSEGASWRSMVDIDVLMHPAQFGIAADLLNGLGYRPLSDAPRFDSNFHLAPYGRIGEVRSLEVHRHLGWQHRILDSAEVLREGRPIAPGLLLPSATHRALHAIIHWQVQDHGASRGNLPLKEVLEVQRFLLRADVDWPSLLARARAAGILDACERAIAAACELLRAPRPPGLDLDAKALRQVSKSLNRRQSPFRTWLAREVWRAGTLWRCEKTEYRASLAGAPPWRVKSAVWFGRAVRMPLLLVRALGITLRGMAFLVRAARPGDGL